VWEAPVAHGRVNTSDTSSGARNNDPFGARSAGLSLLCRFLYVLVKSLSNELYTGLQTELDKRLAVGPQWAPAHSTASPDELSLALP